MEEAIPLASPPPRKISGESGFFEVALNLNSSTVPSAAHPDIEAPVKTPVSKKPSLKKKTSGSVFDGAIHMGFLWYFNQNPQKKSPEEMLWKTREEKLTRILRLDPKCMKNQWKRYFAVIWNDGRFAWYKPDRVTLYNKRATAELEEVLFVPWRVCAFGPDVIHKLCPIATRDIPVDIDQCEKQDAAQLSPKSALSSSPPTAGMASWTVSLLENATKGLCICTSPSVVSLMVPASPASSGISAESQEELVCIMPKTSKDTLLIAVGGQAWQDGGEVFCFASESYEDLELWRASFALLTHRKTVQRSAFDHLLNTPVTITIPMGPPARS